MPSKRVKSLREQLFLQDLIDAGELQKFQDNFSAVTDVAIRTLDAQGNRVTAPSREPRLCSELIKDRFIKDRVCGHCLPTFLGGDAVVDKNLSFYCLLGLRNFVIPLKVHHKAFGYVIVGPVVLVARKPKEEYRKAVEELGVDLEEFWSALLEIKVMSFHGVESLMKLIKDVGEYPLKLAYKNLLKEKEVVMVSGSAKLSHLLEALLDVAFEISRADIGSIMVYDKANKELKIHTSRGIANDIVRNTRVKLGTGISGIAAKEGEAFLLDDNNKDNRIAPYLNRPSLRSSMVIPLRTENRVVGVMNLGALGTSSVRFNRDSISLMRKLADLATVAF